MTYLPFDEEEYWAAKDGDRNASPAEWDREGAREEGRMRPERAWILSDRDAWYPNPFYQGPPVPHPESDGDE